MIQLRRVSVSLSVCHVPEPCKTAERIDVLLKGSKKHCSLLNGVLEISPLLIILVILFLEFITLGHYRAALPIQSTVLYV